MTLNAAVELHLERMSRIEAPTLGALNWQVRTAASVPFASYMAGRSEADRAPSVDVLDLQVRTAASVPFADYMAKHARAAEPSAEPVGMQVRTAATVPFNPYMLSAYAEDLLKRRVMISPVLVVWRYRIANDEKFASWLATQEILLSESRISGDGELKGVRYGGTYRIASGTAGQGSRFKTVWGYMSEAAMNAMHRLCSEGSATATIVQLELIEFVKGIRSFIAQAGEKHFAQEVLIAAAAGKA
ncbi:MAG TPA: hypothetical protein VNK52_06330 [Hyphomicrobiaceae bacterium]|nr:hypothetical protein [Hyphomicrobiaceae bacterium]